PLQTLRSLPCWSLVVAHPSGALLSSLFFFYCSADLRVLHSFPTRRSSDLANRLAGGDDVVGAWVAERVEPVHPTQPPHRDPGSKDRKSTRLNSSHVSISYAVFCLKKKSRTPEAPYARPPAPAPSLCPAPPA